MPFTDTVMLKKQQRNIKVHLFASMPSNLLSTVIRKREELNLNKNRNTGTSVPCTGSQFRRICVLPRQSPP